MQIENRTYTIVVAGEELHVCTLTPQNSRGQEPVLVFLHEALGSVAQWRDFPESMVHKCGLTALLYDRCGFGKSQALKEPRGLDYFNVEMSCLKSVLDTCDVEKAILVGHSDGATLALLFAAEYPERVSAVISEAAHLFVEEETLAGIRSVINLWENTDMRQRLERYHGAKTEQVFSAWSDTWLAPGFRDWNIEDQMKRVTAPVLAIQGDEDEFATEKQLDAISTLVKGPCTRSLVEDCGHVPHRQAREEVLESMVEFVTGSGCLA